MSDGVAEFDLTRAAGAVQTAAAETLDASRRGVSLHKLLKSSTATIGAIIVVVVIAVAVFAPWLSPHDPLKQDILRRLQAPSWVEGGSPENLLGTDTLGRDLLSRIIHGSRISLVVGVAAVVLSGGIGVTAGLVSGYYGGRLDSIMGRIADVQLSIPFLVLAIAVVAIIGPSLFNLILVLAITTWVLYYRVVRGEVLSVREEEYIAAAKVIGGSTFRIIFRHVLPNVTASIVVIATLLVANTIIFEASLSFLGLGVPPPAPTWGRMVADGREHIAMAWWISTFPGLAILFTVLGINLLGDWLRDTLDPKHSL